MPLIDRAINSLYAEVSRVSSPLNAAERSVEIKSIGSRHRKLATTILNKTVSVCPGQWDRLLTKPYRLKGFEVVGYGGFSTVVRDGDGVLKIQRLSESMNRAEQVNLAQSLTEQQDRILPFLKSYALEQTFDVANHPARPADSVVVARQPLVSGYKPLAHKHLPTDPGSAAQLYDFASSSIALHREYELLPDLAGSGNIGFAGNGRLTLIDTLPIDASQPDMERFVDTTMRVLNAIKSSSDRQLIGATTS